jgi:hypothetical protein
MNHLSDWSLDTQGKGQRDIKDYGDHVQDYQEFLYDANISLQQN